MFIEKLTIHNFKGFKDKEIVFKDKFSVIIGNNGSGKTSILDALAIASGCYLIPLGGGQKCQRTIHKEEVRLDEIHDAVFEPQLPCEVEASGPLGTWKRTIEKKTFSNTTKYAKELTKISAKVFDDSSNPEKTIMLPVFAYHGTGRLWAELQDSVEYKKQGARTEAYDNCFSVKSSSKAFRNWYKTLEKNADKKGSEEIKTRLSLFKEAIVSCLEDWDDLYFDFAEDDIICKRNNADGTTLSMPYRMMSDGYRNIIGMIADIAYRCIKLNPHLGVNALKETEGLVLIDELDLHLHPQWQRNIVSELISTFPKIQFIATSHSPFIVQSLKSSQLINLEDIELINPPCDVSLETNALYMGVESIDSKIFDDKKMASKKFFEALNLYSESRENADDVERLFDEYMKRYSDDPVFIAKLEMKKIAKISNEADR